MSADKKQKCKVLFVVTKSVWGGAQRYVYELATALPKDQFEMVAAAGGQGPLITHLHDAGIRTEEIRGFVRDISFIKELWVLRELFLLLRKEKPDIVHLNSSKAGFLGTLAGVFYRLTGGHIRIVFTVHGWEFFADKPLWLRGGIFVASWVASLFQDAIIVISQCDRIAAGRFLSSHKIIYIPNGTHPPAFVSRTEARRILGEKIGVPIRDNEFVFGTVAELTRNKGLTYLIHAIAQSALDAPCRFIIVGDGEDRKVLEESIKEYHLSNTVSLAGFIEDAGRLMKGFDCFILPSIKEGLPYVVQDAMHASLPIIATHVGGIPDMILGGQDGMLVPAKDSRALAQAFKNMLHHPKRENFGEHVKKKIVTAFSFDVMVAKTIALYL